VHGDLSYGANGTFGFDTHQMLGGDISPADETNIRNHPTLFKRIDPLFSTPHYWTFEEVKSEVIDMAEQFKRREQQHESISADVSSAAPAAVGQRDKGKESKQNANGGAGFAAALAGAFKSKNGLFGS
jgi:hypothetical protein